MVVYYGSMQWYMVMELSVSGTAGLSRPIDSEGIGSVEEGDGRRSTTVGSKTSDGGQAQQRRSKERQRRSE